MTSFQHVVSETEINKRIDKLLTEKNPNVSRSQIQTWINEQLVAVNGQTVKANYKCQQGDIIQWTVPENKPLSIQPENIPLDIIYEDHYILVVNKPKGMVVYPTADHPNGTLVNALLYHCDRLSNINGNERPGIVHRLDKDTSGLLLVAKDDKVHLQLSEQLVNQTMMRVYEAIVHGVIEHETGLIDAPIGRDPSNRIMMAVVEDGKQAITHFKVLAQYKNYTHVECQLETGRTHQIRVHMKYIGHPIVGDTRYNTQKTMKLDGQALFAKELGFTHPIKNKWMDFQIDQPDYFKNLLVNIEKMT